MPGIATAATSALSGITNGVNSSSATQSAEATINNNAQQQLEIAQAQSNASLLQALGDRRARVVFQDGATVVVAFDGTAS